MGPEIVGEEMICGGLTEAELLALGADPAEARAVARAVGSDVQELSVTPRGYVSRTYRGEERVLPHGWMADAVGGPERPAPTGWCSGCGTTGACDQCRRLRGVLADVVHCCCRGTEHDATCPLRDVIPVEDMGPPWRAIERHERVLGRNGWETIVRTVWLPPLPAPGPKPARAVAPAAAVLEPFEVIVLDTETTGRHETARVVELAAARVDVHSGRVLDSRGMLLDPCEPIPRDATRVHGITDDMVRGRPTFSQVWPKVIAFAGDLPVIAHNSAFDRKRLEHEINRAGLPRPGWRWWCSLSCARRASPGQPSYALQSLATALDLRSGTSHRAMGDVHTTAALLHACALRAGRWSVWAGPALAVWDEREAARGLFGSIGGAA
mgnify:CR=1 FL=1